MHNLDDNKHLSVSRIYTEDVPYSQETEEAAGKSAEDNALFPLRKRLFIHLHYGAHDPRRKDGKDLLVVEGEKAHVEDFVESLMRDFPQLPDIEKRKNFLRQCIFTLEHLLGQYNLHATAPKAVVENLNQQLIQHKSELGQMLDEEEYYNDLLLDILPQMPYPEKEQAAVFDWGAVNAEFSFVLTRKRVKE